MSLNQKWVIEKRDADGRLDFSKPQPEDIFGIEAITGCTEDHMVRVIYRRLPNVVLDGRNIPHWPALVDGSFYARKKTW